MFKQSINVYGVTLFGALLYFYVFVACECNTTEASARARLPWEDFLICGF